MSEYSEAAKAAYPTPEGRSDAQRTDDLRAAFDSGVASRPALVADSREALIEWFERRNTRYKGWAAALTGGDPDWMNATGGDVTPTPEPSYQTAAALADFIAEQRDAHPRVADDMDSEELAFAVLSFLAAVTPNGEQAARVLDDTLVAHEETWFGGYDPDDLSITGEWLRARAASYRAATTEDRLPKSATIYADTALVIDESSHFGREAAKRAAKRAATTEQEPSA